MPVANISLVYSILSLEGILFLRQRLESGKAENTRLQKAKRIIRDHTFASNAFGLLPIPIVDIAAVSLTQLSMLTRLARLYGLPFRKDAGKALISIAVHGLSSAGIYTLSASLFKGIPWVGPLTSVAAISAHATAVTLLIGYLFLQHFEAGGTLLNFDPKQVREYFHNIHQEAEQQLNKEEASIKKPPYKSRLLSIHQK